MIKRIGLLIVAALVAAMMMVATAAPAFAQNNMKECQAEGGTWDSSTKTCLKENGNPPTSSSPVSTTTTFENTGTGDQTGSHRSTSGNP